MIAIFDVDYRGGGARAACVLIDKWEATEPSGVFIADVNEVAPYESGHFFLRELPCIDAALKLVPHTPEVLVVDGYVWLGRELPGLGARLSKATGGMPVVGIAKSRFKDLEDSGLVEPVFRGQSLNPLFVTAVGYPLGAAARAVASMCGEHRIPDMLRLVDQMARSVGATETMPVPGAE